MEHTEKAATPLDSARSSILFPARSYLNRDGNTSDCDGESRRHVSLQSTNNYLISRTVLVKAKTFLHIFILIKSHFLVQREIKVASLSSGLKGFGSRHLKACDWQALLIPGLGDNTLKKKMKSPSFRTVRVQGHTRRSTSVFREWMPLLALEVHLCKQVCNEGCQLKYRNLVKLE